MTEQPSPNAAPPPPRYNWSEVWTAVIFKPVITTFYEILNDPQANARRAYTWIFLSGMLTAFMFFYAAFNNPNFTDALISGVPDAATIDLQSLMVTTLICITPFSGLLSVLVFIVLVAAVQFIAAQFDPQARTPEKFQQLMYVLAAAYVPVQLIALVFLIVPFLSFLGLFLQIYQVYLMVLGTRAVFNLDVRQAIIAALAPLMVFYIFSSLVLFV